MSGFIERQSAAPTLPTVTVTDAVPSGAANTGGLDLSAYVGSFIALRCTSACRLRAAASLSAATAGDWPLPANERLDAYVTPSTKILSVYGDAAGTLYVARASE